MKENYYYSKYLKYKMKYLREKEMQIGGEEVEIQINYSGETFLLVIDTTKNVKDIKYRIFIIKNIPVDKQILVYNKITLKDETPINTFFPKVQHLGISINLVIKSERDYDLTIIYGTKKPSSIMKVNSEITIANLTLRIPDYEHKRDAKKFLYESSGRDRFDIGEQTRKIPEYIGKKIMVKYEYEIHVKQDEDTSYQISVLNTDNIRKVYEKMNELLGVLPNKRMVINFNGIDINIDDKKSLEEIGIRPSCGLYDGCQIMVKYEDIVKKP